MTLIISQTLPRTVRFVDVTQICPPFSSNVSLYEDLEEWKRFEMLLWKGTVNFIADANSIWVGQAHNQGAAKDEIPEGVLAMARAAFLLGFDRNKLIKP